MNKPKMILYHYSVDSYQSGEKLINDFKKQYRFADRSFGIRG